MVPTLTDEGIVGTRAPAATCAVRSSTSCPFAKCTNAHCDNSLGPTFVSDREVTALRVLLVVQKMEPDDSFALPDAANLGLRVERFARFGLEPDREDTYLVKTAGKPGDVQWLLTASAGDTFLITSTLQQDNNADRKVVCVLAHLLLTEDLRISMTKLMLHTITDSHVVLITHEADSSPLKRLRDVVGDSMGVTTTQPLLARRRLE